MAHAARTLAHAGAPPMNPDGSNILLFAIVAVVFFVAVIVTLAWGYGRLSARNRNK